MSTTWLPISVIICTYNREKLLLNCLQSIREQLFSPKNYEVLVVDNNSSDATPKLVDRFLEKMNNLRYIYEKKQGLSIARNTGCLHSQGEYLVYLDDDVLLPGDYLSHVYRIRKHHHPDILGGPVHPVFMEQKPQWFRDVYETRSYETVSGFSRTCSVTGANFIIRKDVLVRLGLFDTRLGMKGKNIGIGEDRHIVDTYRSRTSIHEQRVYYATECYVKHRIPKYKLNIVYRLERSFVSGMTGMYRKHAADVSKERVIRLCWQLIKYPLSIAAYSVVFICTVYPRLMKRRDPVELLMNITCQLGIDIGTLMMINSGKKSSLQKEHAMDDQLDNREPIIGIGMFLHNEEPHLREAIESLLAQTYRNFTLFILDDCSTDTTAAIALEYAKKDKRIIFERNKERKGYIANYRTTFERIGGPVKYFAWAAGHDIHHPQWLEKCVEVLEAHPDTVMVYPQSYRISEKGTRLPVYHPSFQTFGLSAWRRISALALDGDGFGNMIYGVFRAKTLRKVHVFPAVLFPDVVLLWHLSLYGSFKQIEKVLWYRRFAGLFSLDRQRKIAFRTAPRYTYLPWFIVNPFVLFWYSVICNTSGTIDERLRGCVLSVVFFFCSMPKLTRDTPILGRGIRVILSACKKSGFMIQSHH